jgi:tetratricopeptide (TPR) repeat protein
MTSFRLVLVLLLLGPGLVFAEVTSLEAKPTTPYFWRIVVQFEAHPAMTPAYRDRIQKDIQAALIPSLGDVGKLEVLELNAIPVESRTPLEARFLKEGWAALDSPEFRTISSIKTHFVKISLENSRYRIESRQHDGLTGLASPMVRSRETASPETVGRLVGLMLGSEFGVVGLVELIPGDADHVIARFRGSSLLGFERFLKAGDIFAVSVIRERRVTPPNIGTVKRGMKEPEPEIIHIGQPREFTLIRTQSVLADGGWKCEVLTRFINPFPSSPDIAGYRCIKLATVDAPVRVRVVDSEGNPQTGNQLLEVRATDRNFAFSLEPRDSLELREGVFRSTRPMRNVACIVVGIGSSRKEFFPVPVLGQGPVTIRFAVNPEETARAAFERSCQDLRGRIAECRVSQLAMVQAMGSLMAKGRYGEALERAQTGIKTITQLDQGLTEELEKLKADELAQDQLPTVLLNDSQQILGLIRGNLSSIADKVKELEQTVARSNDNTRFEREFRAKELSSRIRDLVAGGDVPEALEMYDLLIDLTKDEELKTKKGDLEYKWKTRNLAHTAARDYISGPWRTASTLEDFREAQIKLADAVDVMVKNADPLGLRKVIATFEPAYAQLNTILSRLDANSETDRASVKEIKEISDTLRKLETTAREEVRRLEMIPNAGGK